MTRSLSLSALLLFSLLDASSCKNFIGNPHRKAMLPRVVPTTNSGLHVEPANWWTGMKHNQVEIIFQRPDLSSYEVRLGKTDGVKLLEVKKGDSQDCLLITLEISAKAPRQKVPVIFSKGENTFTHEYPVLAPKKS